MSLSKILRELAPALLADDAEELKVLIGWPAYRDDPLRSGHGLCLLVRDRARKLGLKSELPLHELDEAFTALYGNTLDPFKSLGASYFDPVIDYPLRGREALRIADWLGSAEAK